MLYITRPPFTNDEATVLKKLVDALHASPGHFCIGAFTPEIESPCLFYSCQSTNLEAKICPLKTPTESALAELHSHCIPPFDEALPHDEPVRVLPTSSFSLNFDPLANHYGIVTAISAFMEQVPGVEIRMCKLNSYGVGGYSKAHQDTPKSAYHIGTLLIGLPSHYTGGQLLLRDSMKRIATIDWNTKGRSDRGNFPWVFFTTSTKHGILPIKSGYRLTLAFDVFSIHDVKYQAHVSKFNIDVESSAIYKELTAALKNREFLTSGGRLAFGLSHEYPAEQMRIHLLSIIKGSDMILWKTLRALGLEIEVKAAYDFIDIEETPLEDDEGEIDSSDSDDDRYPVDNFSYYNHETAQVMLTSDSFDGVDEDSIEGGARGDSLYDLLERDADAEVERDIIWVTRPLRFTRGAAFACDAGYTYDPSVDYSYVAGVLIATIPASGFSGRL